MAKKTMAETGIFQNYSVNMANKRNMNAKTEYSEFVYEVMIASITEVLATKKKKDEPVAFVFRDLKGNFKFGAIVSYEEESSDMPGNWTYSFTFDEKDVADIANQTSINDPDSAIIIRNEANARHGLVFTSNTYCFDVFEEAIDTLLEYLNVNATADDVLEVEFPGYFVASVGIEDGVKVFSMTPSASMKQAIKDDKAV